MASRREQKEELRREREERERQAKAAHARKRLVGYGAAGVLVLAAAVVAAILLSGGGDSNSSTALLPDGGSVPKQSEFDLTVAAREAGCKLRDVKATGVADHTQDPKERVKYGSNPPTNGRHFIVPADDGEYSDAPTDEELVHVLEHGRVIIWFEPTLPRDERSDLAALFDEDNYQMLLVPRSDMPYQVAASAWNGEPAPAGVGRLLTCDRTSDGMWDALRAFRDEHRSNGPEPIP